MTIKNIAFSGFMAAIMLNVTAANAADPIAIASKTLVTKTAESLQANIDLKQNALKTSEAGRVVIDEDDNISVNLSGYATEQYITDSLSGEGAIAGAVNTAIKNAVDSGEIGDAIADAVKDKADTSYVAGELDKYETKDSVTLIRQALENADSALDSRVTTNANDIAGLKTADTELDGRIDAIEGAGYQDSTQVGSAIDAKINALDLANAYDAKGAADGALAEAKTYAEGEADAAESAAKAYADGLAVNYDAAGAADGALASAKAYTDELANGAVKTNTANIATNAANIATNTEAIAGMDLTQTTGDYVAYVAQENGAVTATGKTFESAMTGDAVNTANAPTVAAVTAYTTGYAIPKPASGECDFATCVLSVDKDTNTLKWIEVALPTE